MDEHLPTDGVELASFIINTGLIALLMGKGILTAEDADRTVDNGMLLLEQLGLSEQPRERAHKILEQTRALVAARFGAPASHQ